MDFVPWAGHGWMIFALPGAEVAFHPHDKNNQHQMYFVCATLSHFVLFPWLSHFQVNSFRSGGIDRSISSTHAVRAAIASGLLNGVHPSRDARVRSASEKLPDINAMCRCLQPF